MFHKRTSRFPHRAFISSDFFPGRIPDYITYGGDKYDGDCREENEVIEEVNRV